jgi:hypothetical protein
MEIDQGAVVRKGIRLLPVASRFAHAESLPPEPYPRRCSSGFAEPEATLCRAEASVPTPIVSRKSPRISEASDSRSFEIEKTGPSSSRLRQG